MPAIPACFDESGREANQPAKPESGELGDGACRQVGAAASRSTQPCMSAFHWAMVHRLSCWRVTGAAAVARWAGKATTAKARKRTARASDTYRSRPVALRSVADGSDPPP